MKGKLSLRRGLKPVPKPEQQTLPGVDPAPVTMRLWHLFARGDLPENDNPWNPWYDTAEGFVVRAESEHRARQLATQLGGDEVRRNAEAWMNSRYSHCHCLPVVGAEEVIIRDFNAA